MSESHVTKLELPNIVTLLAEHFKGTSFARNLYAWENVIFSVIIIAILVLTAYCAMRRRLLIPGRLQNAFEFFAASADDFVCGILGPQGRNYTPFIGTLFIYIVTMNLFGLIPLMKSPTSSWSTTLALALCVFAYVQYSGLKALGFKGYLYHMMGNPKGAIALSVIMPLLMLFLEIIAELLRPISLSLRLRSNVWGEDVLLAIMAGFGLKGVPLLFVNTLLTMLTSVIQAVVFCLLTTIYFSLVLTHQESTE